MTSGTGGPETGPVRRQGGQRPAVPPARGAGPAEPAADEGVHRTERVPFPLPPLPDAHQLEAQQLDAQQVEAQQVDAQQVEAQQVDAQQVEAQQVEARRSATQQLEARHLEVRHAPPPDSPATASLPALDQTGRLEARRYPPVPPAAPRRPAREAGEDTPGEPA